MTAEQAFLTVDRGSATTAVALVARHAGRWRYLAHLAAPAAIPVEAIVEQLLARTSAADPDLAAMAGFADPAADLSRLEVRTAPAQKAAIVGASDRAARPLAAAARATGWRLTTTTADRDDPLVMAGRLLDPEVALVVVGAGEPPGADERAAVAELAALVGGVAHRRPELRIVLAGSMAIERSRLLAASDRPAEIVETLLGEPLVELLDGLRAGPDDGRARLATTAATLAEILERRVELLEIGASAGARIVAEPTEPGEPARVHRAIVASAGLLADDGADGLLDGVAAWSSLGLDRLRLADRLTELRSSPWADPSGDGARLRLAAARAALTRLLVADPSAIDAAVPDVLVVSGGVFALAPAPAVALAVADVVRRPGATQLALDHARALAPLGMIEDPVERRTIMADLAGDLLLPLGGLLVAGGVRPGRPAGRLRVHGPAGVTDLELVPGALELVDLPPGETATLEVDLRDGAVLAGRGRRLALEIAGGLGGLLVDLRGVPLRLPDRAESRRALLLAWERALWTGLES